VRAGVGTMSSCDWCGGSGGYLGAPGMDGRPVPTVCKDCYDLKRDRLKAGL